MPDILKMDNAHEIIPRLWLGNFAASQDEQFLKQNGIETVFNCTKDLAFHPSIRRRYRVPVNDNLEREEIRNMELWAYEIVYKLQQEYKEGKGILVHCAAGMQRSPAVIAMFLIAMGGMKSEDAIRFLQSKRPVAFFANVNFGPAIRGFEESLLKLKLAESSK